MTGCWTPIACCSSAARRLLRSAGDFLYPPACFWCGEEETCAAAKASPHDRVLLCGNCRSLLAPPIPFACARCGAPVGPHLQARADCPRCREDRFRFDRLIRLGIYDGPLRQAVLRAKQPHGQALAAALAQLLWDREQAAFRAAGCDLVMSVPAYWPQRITRGRDAAETAGRLLAASLQLDFAPHILRKAHATPAQASLLPTARRDNLRNVFRIRFPSLCRGANVLLVDDVLTTGTTANRLASLLKSSGVESVTVAVLARGIGAI